LSLSLHLVKPPGSAAVSSEKSPSEGGCGGLPPGARRENACIRKGPDPPLRLPVIVLSFR
jgi:hypothetical protein